MNHLFSHLCIVAVLVLSAQPSIPVALGADEEIDFDRDIRPILEQHCQSCHSAEAHQSGLVVETLDALLEGGALDGPAVIAGNSAASPLIARLKGDTEPAMPMSGSRLTDGEISLIAAWIDQLKPADGAADRAGGGSKSWPWTRLALPEVPTVKQQQWIRNPVDAFVLAALEEKGMEPAPPASRRALLRRIHFGLNGLPPSPEAMAAFLRGPLGGCLPRRHREAPEKSGLRRALGKALAGPGALLGHGGRIRRLSPAPHVAIPGLRDPGFQPGHAL